MFFSKTKEQRASDERVKAVVGIAKDLLHQKLSSTELMYFEDGNLGPLVQAIKVRLRSEGGDPTPLVEHFIAFQTVFLKLSELEQEKFRKAISVSFKRLYQAHAKFQIDRMYHNSKEQKELNSMFAYGVNSKGQAEGKLKSDKVKKYQQFTDYLLTGAGRDSYKDREARMYLISISSRLYNLKQTRPGGSKTELNSTRSFDVNDDISSLISVIHRLKEISSAEFKEKNKDEVRYLSDLISVGLKPWFYRQLYNHMKAVKGSNSASQIEEWFEQVREEVQQVEALNGERDLKEARYFFSDFSSRLTQLKEIDSLDQMHKHKKSAGSLTGLFKQVERVAMPAQIDVPETSFGHGFVDPLGVLPDLQNMAKAMKRAPNTVVLSIELKRMDRLIEYYKGEIFTNPIRSRTNIQVLVNLVKAADTLKELTFDTEKFADEASELQEKMQALKEILIPLADNASMLIKELTGVKSVDALSKQQLRGALYLVKEQALAQESKAKVRFAEDATGAETRLSNQEVGSYLKRDRQYKQDIVEKSFLTLGDSKASPEERKKARALIESDTTELIMSYEKKQSEMGIESGFEANGGWRIVQRFSQLLEHNECSSHKVAVNPPESASSNLKACYNEAVKLQSLSKMAIWIGEMNKFFEGVEEGEEYDQSFDAADIKEIDSFVRALKPGDLTGQSESANLTRKMIAPAIGLLEHYQKQGRSVERPLAALLVIQVKSEKSKIRKKARSFGGDECSPETTPNTSIESGPTDSDCRHDDLDLDDNQRPGF